MIKNKLRVAQAFKNLSYPQMLWGARGIPSENLRLGGDRRTGCTVSLPNGDRK